MSEILLRATGYRKCGLIDSDVKASLYDSGSVRIKLGTPAQIPDIPIYSQDQKKTMACSSFGTTHAMNHEITQLTKQQGGVSPWDLWTLQKQLKPSVETEGDTFAHAFALAEQYGFDDPVTKCTYFPKIYRVKKDKAEIKKILKSEKPIITGVQCLFPFVDKDIVWRANVSGGGHCVVIYDCDENYLYLLNSWAKFGVKKGGVYTGVFKIKWTDMVKMMGMYVLSIDRIIPFQK